MKSRPALLVVILFAVIAALQVIFLQPAPEVRFFSAIGEGFVALLMILGLFIVQRLRGERPTYMLLMLGLTFFGIHEITDAIDELMIQPAYVNYILEDVFQIVGAALLILGILAWNVNREKARLSLAKSEELLRSFMQSATDGFLLFDSRLVLFEMNEAAEKNLNLPRKKNIGRHITEIAPDIKEKGRYDHYVEVLRTGRPWTVEDLVPHPKFGNIHLHVKAFKVGDGLGIVTTDITGLKLMEERLRKSNRMKDLFIDIVNHDLVGKVFAIKGLAEIIGNENLPGDLRSAVERIRQSAEVLLELIENAMNLSRIDAQNGIDMKRLDLAAVIEEVISELEPSASEKGIRIDYHLNGSAFAPANDSISVAYQNILSNAVKYSPSGSLIEVSLSDEGEAFRLKVADMGAGVPDQFKKSIFERFMRKTKEGVKGSGLGLAIVKRVMELHRGNVWVEDNPEGGSIFYIDLPKKDSSGI